MGRSRFGVGPPSFWTVSPGVLRRAPRSAILSRDSELFTGCAAPSSTRSPFDVRGPAVKNDKLREKRERLPSSRKPGQPMSRVELAALVTEHLYPDQKDRRSSAFNHNYLGKLENGRISWPKTQYRAALRAVLGVATDEELGFTDPGADTTTVDPVRRRDLLGSVGTVIGAGVVGTPPMSPLASAVKSFRAADRQVGGGHLYATVVKYLQTEVAPHMFGVDHGGDGRLVFTAAAALTEMAGWMAHDAGRDQAAERHFARAFDLVKLGRDRQLAVHIMASQSHLANHRGKPVDAIQYARRGREALAHGPGLAELEARLLAMQARGAAALRRSNECAQLLTKAEQVLEAQPAEKRSLWVSHFDEGSLANETARCLRQLGDLAQAERQAKRVIELRPEDRTRSRAFGQLILVTVLITQGRPDEACAIAQEVLDSTQQLSSYLVIQQLLDLKRLLEPYQGTRVVADFLSRLDVALRERVRLYQR